MFAQPASVVTPAGDFFLRVLARLDS